jgi:predicted esterase
MPRTRIPTTEDFARLSPRLTVALHFPSPPESTTAILLLFHGLGDWEVPFQRFSRNLSLPGVLAISVRGPSALPGALLGDLGGAGLPDAANSPSGASARGSFHWGDDLTLRPGSEELDPDPGFEKAADLVLGRLVRETLLEKCGWETEDILLFGFGQGGSFALGLASRVRIGERVVELKEGDDTKGGDSGRGTAFKGVVSIGGSLPTSMIPTVSSRSKARTPVLLCHGSASEALDEDAVAATKREFADVREVKWKKIGDGMPSNTEEMFPVMQFFADRLRGPF